MIVLFIVFINPCPVALPSSQITYCSENNLNSCGFGQWCHVGANRDSTLCCPNGITLWYINCWLLYIFGLLLIAVDACSIPVVRGGGNANLPRWSYDATARQCSQFYYGGLGGNQNNFLSRQACETACPSNVVFFLSNFTFYFVKTPVRFSLGKSLPRWPAAFGAQSTTAMWSRTNLS